MAVTLLARWAAGAQIPVLTVAGGGARDALLGLRACDDLELVASPRHATILLVGGSVPVALLDVVAQVHDQLPEPRAVLWWGGDEHASELGIDGVIGVAPEGDVVATLREVYGQLLSGERSSTAPVGPPRNPVAWRGVGPHGQGGEGMMGGQPYGRPMPMTGPDLRDGLQLDRVPLRIGPVLPGLPPGLALEIQLQGDVIQQAELGPDPFLTGERVGRPLPSTADVLRAARTGEVALADVEVARARHHLLRVAEALDLHGLHAAGVRVARLAVRLDAGMAPEVARLRRWLHRRAVLRGTAAGIGRLDAATAADLGLTGPVARAAGLDVDARREEPAYGRLGFRVTTRRDGDARARWEQRLDESVHALELAAAAGDATVGPDEALEDPRAPHDVRPLIQHLPHLLQGLEWGDAITTIASLDLDLEAAADVPLDGTPPVPA